MGEEYTIADDGMVYYKLNSRFVVTSGVKAFCDENQCWWMLDIIASYQSKCLADPMLRDIQFWRFEKPTADATTGVMTCDRDAGNEAIRQSVEFTDFKPQSCRIWVEPSGDGRQVALMPEEH